MPFFEPDEGMGYTSACTETIQPHRTKSFSVRFDYGLHRKQAQISLPLFVGHPGSIIPSTFARKTHSSQAISFFGFGYEIVGG